MSRGPYTTAWRRSHAEAQHRRHSRKGAGPSTPGARPCAAALDRPRPFIGQCLAVRHRDAGVVQPREPALVHLAGRERGVLGGHHAQAGVEEPDRRLVDADVGLEADEHGRAPARAAHRVRISGVPASPNVGLMSTGVPGASSIAVLPLRSGSSSVATTGTSSSCASLASQAARASASSAAARSASSCRIEARLRVDDDKHASGARSAAWAGSRDPRVLQDPGRGRLAFAHSAGETHGIRFRRHGQLVGTTGGITRCSRSGVLCASVSPPLIAATAAPGAGDRVLAHRRGGAGARAGGAARGARRCHAARRCWLALLAGRRAGRALRDVHPEPELHDASRPSTRAGVLAGGVGGAARAAAGRAAAAAGVGRHRGLPGRRAADHRRRRRRCRRARPRRRRAGAARRRVRRRLHRHGRVRPARPQHARLHAPLLRRLRRAAAGRVPARGQRAGGLQHRRLGADRAR